MIDEIEKFTIKDTVNKFNPMHWVREHVANVSATSLHLISVILQILSFSKPYSNIQNASQQATLHF